MDRKAKVAEVLKRARSVLIVSHEGPEADAVGSSLALTLALKSLSKEVFVYNRSKLPKVLRHLPCSELISTKLPNIIPDVLCVVDCSNLKRAGEEIEEIARKCMVLNIDHHITSSMFGDVNFVDWSSPATGVLVGELIEEMGVDITPEIATNVYAAIAKDTGFFLLPTTNVRTLKVAILALERGADLMKVCRVLRSTSLKRIKLIRDFLNTLEVNKGIAFAHVTKSMYRRHGASEEDSEDFVDVIRHIEGVKVAVFIRELEDGRVKASIRSEDVDISFLAREFPGGGHKNAVGCIFDKSSISNVKEILKSKIKV